MGEKWSNKSYNGARSKMVKDGELELGAYNMYKLNGTCLSDVQSTKTTIMTSTTSSTVASRARSIALEALPRVTSIKQSIHDKCKTATSSLSNVPFCLEVSSEACICKDRDCLKQTQKDGFCWTHYIQNQKK